LLGLSGTLLIHKHLWVMLPHVGDAQVQDSQAIVATVEKLMEGGGERPTSIIFATETFGLNRLSFGGDAGAYASQSGEIVARWSSIWERPEIWLFEFHHYLFSGDVGETIAGIAALCGLFFVVSGIILWWRTRKTFEFRLLPKRLSRPAIVRHHRDLGIVVAPLLLISLYTASVLAFGPMLAFIQGPGAAAVVTQSLKPPVGRPAALAGRPDWRAMIETARARFPGTEIRILSLPRGDSGLISLRTRQPEEWLPNGRSTLWFAADTGRLVEARDALRFPRAARVFNMIYPLHSAKVGGLAFRLVMTLSGLSLALLGSLAMWSFWFKRPRSALARRAPVDKTRANA